MAFLSKKIVFQVVEKAIVERVVLDLTYQHTTDGEIVTHRIAPFDIGSTNPNPQIRERNKDNMYAYSYTHLNGNTNQPDPKVCAFNVNHCISLVATDETFDENELAKKHLKSQNFDYTDYPFAIVPNRDWFDR